MPVFSELKPFDTESFGSLLTKAVDLDEVYVDLKIHQVNGRRVPCVEGRGYARVQDKAFKLVLCRGVGFSIVDGRNPELVIWMKDATTFYDGVSVDGSVVVMRAKRDNGSDARDLTIQMRFNPRQIDVRYLVNQQAPAQGSDLGHGKLAVWPERVIRFISAGDRRYRTPDCPVRTEIWPYVETCDRAGEQPNAWEVTFTGGVTLTHQVPLDIADHWASIGDDNVDSPVNVAFGIWPHVPLDGLRQYVVVLDKSAVPDERFEFWSGYCRPGTYSLPYRRRTSQLLVVDVPEAQGAFPAFVAIARDQRQVRGTAQRECAGGVFSLFDANDHARAGGQGRSLLGLDLGTSTTVIATNNGPDDTVAPVDLAQSPYKKPRLISTDYSGDAKLREPWLPTMVAPGLQRTDRLDEIPTGLLLLSKDGSALDCPFADYTIVNDTYQPNMNIAPRWFTDLKWPGVTGTTNKKLEVAREARLQAFVTAVVFWTVLQFWTEKNSFALRASYPLAFDRRRRQDYYRILTEACRRVGELTGRNITVERHFSSTHDSRLDEPFCDESVALVDDFTVYLNKVNPVVNLEHEGKERVDLLFNADLGGGTLDTMLAAVRGRSFRVIAAESLRIGANALRDVLKGLVTVELDNSSEMPDEVKDWVLAAVIKSGALDQEFDPGTTSGFPAGVTWSTHKPSAVATFRVRCQLYAVLLLRYCARFIAGSLLDDEGATHRLQHGPGVGTDIAWRSAERPTFLVLRMSGNGWKFLKEDGHGQWAGWSRTRWLEELEKRVVELMRVGSSGSLTVHWDKVSSPLLPKTVTAQGVIRVQSSDVPLGGGAAEAAPSGFDDSADGNSAHWWMQVGVGSSLHTKPAGRDVLWSSSGHVALPKSPEFPNNLLTTDGRQRWEQRMSSLKATLHNNVANAQREFATGLGVEYRAKSTASAMWEKVFLRVVSS